MIPKFFQPAVDVVVGLVLADIVHEESTNRTAIVRRRDSAVAFLAGGIPNLCLDCLGVDLNRAGCELDTDGRLGVQVELVASESAQQIRLANARVTDKDHCFEAKRIASVRSPEKVEYATPETMR